MVTLAGEKGEGCEAYAAAEVSFRNSGGIVRFGLMGDEGLQDILQAA